MSLPPSCHQHDDADGNAKSRQVAGSAYAKRVPSESSAPILRDQRFPALLGRSIMQMTVDLFTALPEELGKTGEQASSTRGQYAARRRSR